MQAKCKGTGSSRKVLIGSTLVLASSAALPQAVEPPAIFEQLYANNCSACHGEKLQGTPTGVALTGIPLRHGDSIDAMANNIATGFPQTGMPAMAATLDATQIREIAIYLSEQRAQLTYTDFKVSTALNIPTDIQHTEKHAFRIETVTATLDAFPFGIAPLPDGSMLVTEKTKGLKLVSADGKQASMIEGTPQAYDDSLTMPGLEFIIGLGWLLDVALDPDYSQNGWVYLQYGDRCSDCNEMSKTSTLPVTMNKLVRGHIRDGKWVDEQTIYQAPIDQYTWMPDQAAGGRIAFDDKGHVFMSIGMKGAGEYAGIQDLSTPYGKVLRLNRDGSIPDDNPYVNSPGKLAAIWTVGHRSPQGLEYDLHTGQLWETEMGPRGGDEVNLVLPGKNYGWPLTSKGMNYDGTPVDYGKQLGMVWEMKDIEQPVLDLTPAPAVSSFIVYEGAQFPDWQHNLLVGTLKATELYRMEVEDGKVVQQETVLSGVGRIRDIETAPDGSILLLIEHRAGGQILRLVHAD